MSPSIDAPQPSWRWLLAALALLSLMLLLAACQSGEAKEEGPAAEEPSVARNISPAQARQELEALSEAWGSASAKILYSFTTTVESGVDTGSMTLYWQPPHSRMDISIVPRCGCVSMIEETTLIVTADNRYRCAVTDGVGQCFSIDTTASQAVFLPFLQEFEGPSALNQAIVKRLAGADIDYSAAKIAGEGAGCYSIEGQADQSQWCFGPDGTLLRLVGTFSDALGAGVFRLDAVTVSREVSEADFQPPFPVS